MTKARDLANIISGGFTVADLPSLTATEIPNLDTAKITTGTFPDARLPSTALNSNVDLTNLNASNLTSGTVAVARLGTGATSTTFLRGDGTFAEAGGGKLLQWKITTDNTTRSQTGNLNSTLSNTLSNTITPTKVGTRIIAFTPPFRWYTYGPGTLSLRRDGTIVNSKSHSNSGYPNADEQKTSLVDDFTTTSTSQLSYEVYIQDTGSSAGSASFQFGVTQGILHLLEIDT